MKYPVFTAPPSRKISSIPNRKFQQAVQTRTLCIIIIDSSDSKYHRSVFPQLTFARVLYRLMESLFLEVAGPALIGGASFGIASFFSISSIEKGLSKQANIMYFCAIPVVVYVIFRIYFLFLFRLTSIGKFSQSRPIACKSASFFLCYSLSIRSHVYCQASRFLPEKEKTGLRMLCHKSSSHNISDPSQ